MIDYYVVETSPQQERLAASEITQLGLEIFFPTFRKKVSHAGRIEYVNKPLFPNYIFAAFDIQEPEMWAPIKRSKGVRRILGQGHPVPVRGDFMTEIQSFQAHNEQEPSKPFYWPGQQLRVLQGPFTGLTGIYEMSDKDRVTILLDMMGGKVKVVLSETAVAA